MITLLKFILGLVAALAVALFAAGQFGLLRGKPPAQLGVQGGRLQPPAMTPNSVTSQADLYPDHPRRAYAGIAPLTYTGDAQAALGRLVALLESTDGCVVVKREPNYVYAQCTTRWLKFTDDVEFYLDEAARVIHVRSASRIGKSDLGANRTRVEALRARFVAS